MKRIFREVSWASVGQVINVGVALITLKVWAVYLTPAELGLMALIISAPSILAGIVIDPLVRAMLVRYSVYAETGTEKGFRTVVWGVIARVVVMCVGSIFLIGAAICYFLDLHWSTPLLVAGLFAVDARRYFEQTLHAAARRQQVVALISVGDVCFRLVFLWLFLEGLDSSAYVAVAGNLTGALIVLTLLLVMTRTGDRPTVSLIDREFSKNVRKEILLIAWPIVPSNVLANVSEMSSRYIIAAMLGLHQAGIFVAVYGLVKRPFGMLSDIGFMAMLPAYSEALAKHNTIEATRIRFIWFSGIVLLSVIGVTLFYFLGETIIAILLSKNFEAAGEYFVIIGSVIAIYNIISIYNGVLLAHGDSRSVLIGNVISAALTVSMLFFLIPLNGLQGAVWAIGVGYILQAIFLFAISLRFSK
jgi:O-antigen/teichoic acid export membrane protein